MGALVILELQSYRLILTLARQGSLTRAGEILHLTQPAVSRQLSGLESRLGCALFERTGRGLRTTAAGRRLVDAAPRILELADRAEREVLGAAGGVSGRIALTTGCYTLYRWLPRIVDRFTDKFPDVQVEIDTQSSGRALAAVADGTLDLAVVAGVNDGDGLETVPLFRDELVAVFSPDHPRGGAGAWEPADFAEEHVILYSAERSVFLDRVLSPAGVRPRRVSGVQSTEGILELVAARIGVSVLAHWAVVAAEAEGRVGTARLGRHGFSRNWSAVLRPSPDRSPYLREFVELLREGSEAFGVIPTRASRNGGAGTR